MARIITGGQKEYDLSELSVFFDNAFSALAISFGKSKVLLKPNLLYGKAPAKAVNTHPLVIQALAEVFLERGCTVFVGDSPGYESTEKALKRSGILAVMEKLKLRVAAFDKSVVKVSTGISPYREILLGEDPLDFDVVVNVPKLKTHIMMGLTAGVKNTFGFVHGLNKAKWHLRCGTNSRLFAALLIDIHRVVDPTVTVLDGIVAMEGDGPSHGRPRNLGLISVSDDALALDAYLENLLRVAYPLPITEVAKEHGLIAESLIIDKGAPVVEDFLMPTTIRDAFSLPAVVRATTRSLLTKKPKWHDETCNGCKTCVAVCGAGAATFTNGRVSFDHGKCIRCYCCAEMCPVGAIVV
jgi:uncharacterized protein (DUF362 family)/NAD-dependent dihydropyrimidine dehydrogenase PreA subunit